MTKFTVLGASGVIGSRLTAHLSERGFSVFAPPRGDSAVFRDELGHVVYAVGVTADFRSKPFDTMAAHVGFLSDILQTSNFTTLTYLSSTRVYARASQGEEESVIPVSPQEPSDLYNVSKIAGEALCLVQARPGIRIARMSNVVGGTDRHDSANFVPSLRRDALKGRIVFNSALTSEKDYIHIDDVVDLLRRISTGGSSRIYNVASGIQTSHKQWADHFQRETGCDIEVAPDAPQLSFPPINNARIRNEFGFSPRPIFERIPAS